MNAYEVAGKIGTPYRTLMHWVGQGLLNPEGARRGRRYASTWNAKDLREATILAALRRAGFSLQRLRKAFEYLRSVGHNPMSTGEFVVVHTGKGEPAELIKFCTSGEALALIRDPGQVVMPLPPMEPDP